MNWKALLKTAAVAAAGAGIQSLAQTLPALQGTKYGVAISAAVLVAGAYGAKSPWVQTAMKALYAPRTDTMK